jgi:hypothetical protein
VLGLKPYVKQMRNRECGMVLGVENTDQGNAKHKREARVESGMEVVMRATMGKGRKQRVGSPEFVVKRCALHPDRRFEGCSPPKPQKTVAAQPT